MEVQKEKIMSALGERIRFIRHKRSLSQEELAFRANINSAYLGQVERGLRCPTIDTLCKIALALEVTPADLMRSTDLPDGAVGYDQRLKEHCQGCHRKSWDSFLELWRKWWSYYSSKVEKGSE